jgi:serine/threonine protein kinase
LILEVDPNKRATTHQILSHPWLADTPLKIDVFTETEKNIIKKEFTYNDT